MPHYDYSCKDCGVIEIFHGILEDDHTVCPKCGKKGIEKMISVVGGIIIKGKQPNQYPEVLRAKYWRDKNGIRHKVTAADGYSKAPTSTSRQYNSPEKIEALKKRDKKKSQKERKNWSYKRFIRRQESK